MNIGDEWASRQLPDQLGAEPAYGQPRSGGQAGSGKVGREMLFYVMSRSHCLLLAAGLSIASASAQTGPPKPKVPPGRDPGGIAVAVIGAGVDYRLPEIAARIARDGEGEIIAWDVIDDDARPLASAPVPGRSVPVHAGTGMASRLLLQAREIRLIPVRIPEANPLALGGALAFTAQTPARIVVLLTSGDGNPQAQSWKLFTDTARRARHLILITAAGHSGQDTGNTPLAPNDIPLDNMLAVTAATADGRIADGASWGAAHVHLAVTLPEASLLSLDTPDRAAALENAAALRLAALVARVIGGHPGLDGAAIKELVLRHAQPFAGTPEKRTRHGWIDAIRTDPKVK